MFNQDLKIEFMNSIKNINAKSVYGFLFQSTEGKEEELGKDLYTFTKQEALGLLSSYELMLPALSSKKSSISKYVDWCVSIRGGINYFSTITSSDMRKISIDPPKYLNLLDVDNLAQKLKNSSDRLILYLFFYGLDSHELSKIRTQHIDFKNNTLYTKERIIKLPRYILDLIVDSCETYRYYNENEKVRATCFPLSTSDNSPIKPRAQSPNKALDTIEQRIRGKLIRIRQITGNDQINRHYLRDSGIIYHIKQVMKWNNLDEDEVFKGNWLDSLREQYKIRYTNRNLKFKYKEMIV